MTSNISPAEPLGHEPSLFRSHQDSRKFPANDVLPASAAGHRTESPTVEGLARALRAAFPVEKLPCNLEIARLGLRLKRTGRSGIVANPIDCAMPTMMLSQRVATRMSGW